jgi:hypothetical protein
VKLAGTLLGAQRTTVTIVAPLSVGAFPGVTALVTLKPIDAIGLRERNVWHGEQRDEHRTEGEESS